MGVTPGSPKCNAIERSLARLEPTVSKPRLHPLLYRKLPFGIPCVRGVQLVGVDFEGNPFVAAAAQESGDILGGKIGQAELSVLHDVNQFMEQGGGGDGSVGNDDVHERDGTHVRKVGQQFFVEPHRFQLGVERRVLGLGILQNDQPGGVQNRVHKKRPQQGLLRGGKRRRLRVPVPLLLDVMGSSSEAVRVISFGEFYLWF
jgi:hypothetical protein